MVAPYLQAISTIPALGTARSQTQLTHGPSLRLTIVLVSLFADKCFMVEKILHDWLFPQVDIGLYHMRVRQELIFMLEFLP